MQSCEHELSTLGYSWNKQTSSGEVGNNCVGRAQCITIVVPLRLAARSSEEVGGVGAGNDSQQIRVYDLVSKPET